MKMSFLVKAAKFSAKNVIYWSRGVCNFMVKIFVLYEWSADGCAKVRNPLHVYI